MIKPVAGGFAVYNHDGTKKLSKTFKSKEAAEKRLRAIEAFKHMDDK